MLEAKLLSSVDAVGTPGVGWGGDVDVTRVQHLRSPSTVAPEEGEELGNHARKSTGNRFFRSLVCCTCLSRPGFRTCITTPSECALSPRVVQEQPATAVTIHVAASAVTYPRNTPGVCDLFPREPESCVVAAPPRWVCLSLVREGQARSVPSRPSAHGHTRARGKV